MIPAGQGAASMRGVAVVIIRHACAGDKRGWPGRDLDRPLDPTGVQQANVLASHFAGRPCHRIVSSPALRCVQTVTPVAQLLDVTIEQAEDVGCDGDAVRLRALALSLDAHAGIICTHGELMRPLLDDFRRDGTPITSSRSDTDWLTGKGTAWTLTFGPRGTIVTVHHVVPPGLPPCPDHPTCTRV
jgi:phosphohistidine phosphatase SixA